MPTVATPLAIPSTDRMDKDWIESNQTVTIRLEDCRYA